MTQNSCLFVYGVKPVTHFLDLQTSCIELNTKRKFIKLNSKIYPFSSYEDYYTIYLKEHSFNSKDMLQVQSVLREYF